LHDSDDPRAWPAQASPPAARLHALAAQSLAAATRAESDRLDAEARDALTSLLRGDDGPALRAVFATAPGAAVCRHLWRLLVESESLAAKGGDVELTTFALPLVIVAGLADAAQASRMLPGVLKDMPALTNLLREHDALAGNRTFVLAKVLAAADALELERLPGLLGAGRLRDAPGVTPIPPMDLPPAPIAVSAGHESVHLRFIVGAALAGPGVDLLAPRGDRTWAMPFGQAVGVQLAVPGASVIALAHAPQRLVPALTTGRALQREVSAQVFVSNALRRMRGGVGEPSAAISAHRAPDSLAGGELRLSLSSPFAPRDAEGFRCPLYATDRIADVVQMLATLLRDCRVADVRIVPGVHADRDAATGVPLLFRADALH